MSLHVHGLVTLIDDLQAQQSFEDVLKRDQPDGAAVLINDYHQVGALLQQGIEGLGW